MKTAISLTVLALCLMIGLPGSAAAGNGGTGACLFENLLPGDGVPPLGVDGEIPIGALCIDSLTGLECAALCVKTGDDPDGEVVNCEFLDGQTCASTGIPWDGACDGVPSPIGALCVLLDSPNPGDSQLFCEESKFGGTWLGDGSVCGGVPALPKLAYGALALVLLAGTLTILTLQSKS